jgi:hypothetical protein
VFDNAWCHQDGGNRKFVGYRFSKRKSPIESFEKTLAAEIAEATDYAFIFVIGIKYVDIACQKLVDGTALMLCDLRPWLPDSLRFMIEQLEEAKSPEDQLAGTDAAMGLIPFLRCRLRRHAE